MRERKEHYMRERDQQFRLDAMRRDYGIDEESFPRQYPVEEQANNIDDTPVHSTGIERQCGRQCGKVDYIGIERRGLCRHREAVW